VGLFSNEEFDVRTLPVGPPEQADERGHPAAFLLPSILKARTCHMSTSAGTRTGTPRVALPPANGDRAKRYRLGIVTPFEPR
jgi:hypothetical protein